MMLRTLRKASLLAALAAIPMAAHGAVIAQNYDTSYAYQQPFYAGYYLAQTFTPTITGTLTTLSAPVHVYYNTVTHSNAANPDSTPITFGIYSVSGGQPSGAPLSTGSIAWSSPGISSMFIQWSDASMTPAVLQSGTTYMLVANVTGASTTIYTWYAGYQAYPGGDYLGGSGLTNLIETGNDLPFQISGVAVPEPTSLALLAIPASLLIRRRPRG